MNTSANPRFLYRFTSLPVLLDILNQKHIVLLDPSNWEDRNDAYYIERYKDAKNLKTVVAMCFSTRRETFHHWKVFSAGFSGVSIKFRAKELISFAKSNKIVCRPVQYKKIEDIESSNPRLEDWPFLKRKPYEDEREYRMLYKNSKLEEQVKPLSIELTWIEGITLSPWMPKTIANSVTDILRQIPECGELNIHRSSLLENSRWKRAITPKLSIAQE